jgi:hypothetical protein
MNSHHHEVWRFVLIRNKVDGEGYLWPIGRDTDIKAKDTLDLEMKRETEMRPDVEWLDISALDLTEFPPELFKMKNLKKLECHSNYIEVRPAAPAVLLPPPANLMWIGYIAGSTGFK